MKKLLLICFLALISTSVFAGLKLTYTTDGRPNLEWIEGYEDPDIKAYREQMKDTKPMSDDEYLRAHKKELRELLENSHKPAIRGEAKFPKEFDKYNR
jgi:hypothetical protein